MNLVFKYVLRTFLLNRVDWDIKHKLNNILNLELSLYDKLCITIILLE